MSDAAVEFVSSPFREGRLWEQGRAFARLPKWGTLQVDGPDAARFLAALWSQRLDALDAGGSAEALLLDAAGHVDAQAAVVRESDARFLLIVEPGQAERIGAWLTSMRFLMQVDVSDISHDVEVLAVSDPRLPRVADSQVRAWWLDPWPTVADGGAQYSGENAARDEYFCALAIVLRSSVGELSERWTSAYGLDVVGWAAPEAARVAAWRPRWGAEADAPLLPHEVDWLRTAVHLDKGCYRGQETVAKVHNVGHPPRRLVFLSLDGITGELPAHGDGVWSSGARVGSITSAVRHWEQGPIALALVKRSVPLDVLLDVEHGDSHVTAAQQVIVPPDAGGIARSAIDQLRAARRGS